MLPFLKINFALALLLFAVSVHVNAQNVGDLRLQAGVADSFGINVDFMEPKRGELRMIAAAGFRWVRVEFKWDVIEKAKGTYDFAQYDRLLAALDTESLRPLFVLGYVNPLYDNGTSPHTEAGRRAFANWAVAAAKHFANRGVLWELYNKPNDSRYWQPQPNVNDYIQLALEVSKQFRATVPAERLIGPATSGIDFDFLEACFKAGLLQYWSAISVHPYRMEPPETVVPGYNRLRDLIKSYKQGSEKDTAIISSEWGYSSVWSGMTDDKESEYLVRQWLVNLGNGVPISIWYSWRDGKDLQDIDQGFGTVTFQYGQKRAYLAAKALTSFLSGYKLVKRFDVGGSDDFVFLFQNGAESRVVAWGTTMRAHRVVVPLGAGKYELTNHLGDALEPVIALTPDVPIEITSSPTYVKFLEAIKTKKK